MTEQNHVINNRYRIIKIIGQGGIGAVWRAEDLVLERDVAVKMLLLEDAKSSDNSYKSQSEFLLNEARMMARIQHPNVMPIYDVFYDEERTYFVMPLLTTHRLEHYFDELYKRPIAESVRLLSHIAEGLDFIHQSGIVHRAIRPSNILLGDDMQPYITDFGIAQSEQDSLPEPETVEGALAYIAPETLKDPETIMAASDLFAFGMITFQVFTGKYPFRATSLQKLVMEIVEKPTPSIGEYRTDLSPALIRDIDHIIASLTAKDPQDRYRNAAEAVEELNRIIYSGNRTIDARLFISYAHADSTYVHELAEELVSFGVDLWFDKNIEYGSEWDTSIEGQLEACDIMIVIATPASMDSYYVTYEWSYFFGAEKAVFPFLPQYTADQVILHPRLQRVQYITGTGSIRQNARVIIEVISQYIRTRQHPV